MFYIYRKRLEGRTVQEVSGLTQKNNAASDMKTLPETLPAEAIQHTEDLARECDELSPGCFSDDKFSFQEALNIDMELDSTDNDEPQGPFSRTASSIERLLSSNTRHPQSQTPCDDTIQPWNPSDRAHNDCWSPREKDRVIRAGDPLTGGQHGFTDGNGRILERDVFKESLFSLADGGPLSNMRRSTDEQRPEQMLAKMSLGSLSKRLFHLYHSKIPRIPGAKRLQHKYPEADTDLARHEAQSPRDEPSALSSKSAGVYP